ncbi:histidine kinase osmosensor [Mortierella polycephala]|uniref:Histidine kinase osmosensor n=1 Tax=Mortierella polycephala TaxID=41804 RepID=A0A9P6U0L7_9FUNG|nr:histidine kinase osmosensor [Mortierella polycephala]
MAGSKAIAHKEKTEIQSVQQQDLHSPPGCVLPVQIDIYALGLMFYYLLTSHTTLEPEDMTPGSITEELSLMAAANIASVNASGSCLPDTNSRVAKVVIRMVAKSSRDRYLSMIQVRRELSLIRDQEYAARKMRAELKSSSRAMPDSMDILTARKKSVSTPPVVSSSYASSTMPRSPSPTNSTLSSKSTSTANSQELDQSSLVSHRSACSTPPPDAIPHEDRAFVLESVLSICHISNLQEMLRMISYTLDNVLVNHPPEEMAIILWQKDEHRPEGGTWAIVEDKFQPGTTQAILTWTELSERRDHMPVLVHKALDTQEPVFSTAVGSRSQLPTIACVPIMSTQDGVSTLVGAIYLHHLHPRFYFTKRDQDMLILFCSKLANSLLNCDKITGLEKQLSLAMQRNRVLEDTIDGIQKNEHEVFSWMEALPCFVWAAEGDDVLSRRYISRSWFDFTGLPGDSRTSDRWISAMHPDDVANFQKEVSPSYKTRVYKDCVFRLMRYDGVYRWHLSRAVPVLNHNGAVLKWVGVTMDIDDLYVAQKAELHKKSNFLANMSHELRTPFSGFHGMLTLLGYSDLNEEQQEFVYTAKVSCEKLLLIIDDLLDFSKLEADKVTLEASPFDLEEVFDEVEDIVESLASQKSLELAFIKDENVPEMLIGDCNRLKQILLNLVGNAIKFTHAGHVLVRCKVLDQDAEESTFSSNSSTAESIDDDKFYFRHEKNGGGQCQSEMRPPNSGRFSSPEPLSESSIKLMFSVEDTGIGISLEEQECLFSPFSQVDGSATRSYGGSGLGLSICLQLVKLMKGRIGLTSRRDQGSTFWFVIQCEQSTQLESPVRTMPEADVVDSTKEIKRITRTLGTPRILIASINETTITTLQAYLSDFNTEVANLPSTASSRLEESVANGIRFDFVCWDFPKYDPNYATMLELQARPNLNNVHFVLLYTPVTEMIRRAQSLQLPPINALGGNGRKRPALSQSASLRQASNSGAGGYIHAANAVPRQEVPGLSPEKLNSLRITCISKPIRRLKLLRAFVEVLDDSARIHGAHAIKKVAATTTAPPSSPSLSATAASTSRASSPTNSVCTSATLSPIAMTRAQSVSMVASLEEVLCKECTGSTEFVLTSRPDMSDARNGAQFLSGTQEQTVSRRNSGVARLSMTEGVTIEGTDGSSGMVQDAKQGEEADTATTTADATMTIAQEMGMGPNTGLEHVPPLTQSPAPIMVTMEESGDTAHEQGQEQGQEQEQLKVNRDQDDVQDKDKVKEEDAPVVNGMGKETSVEVDEGKDMPTTTKEKEKKLGRVQPKAKPMFKSKSTGGNSKIGKLRSNSPKPIRTPKLVTEKATEVSLSFEEAKRIAGMHILLAEDNLIAQKVLSKQLALFGLVISCANDGADALALFKAHPRGYYTLGFFDHHMPNCDGVRATQQIRALEKEHAAEIKGPVPRLPVVAVSADIQETARKACLNSGMERYVTKPLMQKDLVAVVRQYCVEGDAEANTHAYVPPLEGSSVCNDLGSSDSTVVTSTVEAVASVGHVSAPIGANSGLPPSLFSMTTSPTLQSGKDDVGPAQMGLPPLHKRELDLSPAAMRGLALIRENTKHDESSKVGGGGSMGSTAMNLQLFPTGPGTCPMHHSQSHLGLKTRSSYTQLRSAPMTLYKSISASSLSTSYHSQDGVSASSSIVTPAPTSSYPPSPSPLSTATPISGPCSFGSSASTHLPGPIVAMAAGAAAAAVAVASAAVNTVTSALQEHIQPPFIYTVQGQPVMDNACTCTPQEQQEQQQQQQQQQIQHFEYVPFQQQDQQSTSVPEQSLQMQEGEGKGGQEPSGIAPYEPPLVTSQPKQEQQDMANMSNGSTPRSEFYSIESQSSLSSMSGTPSAKSASSSSKIIKVNWM